METVTIPKEEYEYLVATARKTEVFEEVIHEDELELSEQTKRDIQKSVDEIGRGEYVILD